MDHPENAPGPHYDVSNPPQHHKHSLGRLTVAPQQTERQAEDPRIEAFRNTLAFAAEEEREVFVISLQPRHAEYLRARAANHGEPPERHLETILRNFRSYHDDRRPEHRQPPPEPGMPAITRRA